MRRKKQKVAIILFVTLCMGLFSGKISVQNLNAQTSSNDLYTDGQQVNVLELELPEKGIVLTEENAEIDITNLVPEKVEWKYYEDIVVDYELTQEVLPESETENVDYMMGKIQFVQGNLYPTYPEYMSTPYMSIVHSRRDGDIDFFISDSTFDFSHFENSVDKKYLLTLKPVEQNDTWDSRVQSVTITSIRLIPRGNAIYSKPDVTPTPTASLSTNPHKEETTPTSSPMLSSGKKSNTATPQETTKIEQFKVKDYKKKAIKLTWQLSAHSDGYEISRSLKKKSGFHKIATVSGKKSAYVDDKVKRQTVYYYRIRPYCLYNGGKKYGKYSSVKSAFVKQKAPSYQLKKKRTSKGVSYIQIAMKKWSDPYVAIWVNLKGKGFTKIPLSQSKIKKKNGTYNLKYSQTGKKVSFKICTYKKVKKKKWYSYSTQKEI